MPEETEYECKVVLRIQGASDEAEARELLYALVLGLREVDYVDVHDYAITERIEHQY